MVVLFLSVKFKLIM